VFDRIRAAAWIFSISVKNISLFISQNIAHKLRHALNDQNDSLQVLVSGAQQYQPVIH
jgi:hypothetical protein